MWYFDFGFMGTSVITPGRQFSLLISKCFNVLMTNVLNQTKRFLELKDYFTDLNQDMILCIAFHIKVKIASIVKRLFIISNSM